MACASAAVGGISAFFQWARAIDCPWGDTNILDGTNVGYEDVVAWAKSKGCPPVPSPPDALFLDDGFG